jgi:anti-sigma B factor antagonist
MEFHYTTSPGSLVVTILGKLDARTVPDFQKNCAALPVMPTVLDLTGLEYLSSSALRALLHLKREFGKTGTPVVIAGSNGLVDKVLRVSGFEQVFTLYPSVQDARKAITGGGA